MNDSVLVLPNDIGSGADRLVGAEAIANFTGEPLRRTRWLLEKKLIPAGQVGRIWYGSKAVLRQHYASVTSGQAR